MNRWANAVMTSKGLALQSKLITGTTLTITKVVIGAGYVTPGLLQKQTEVSEPKKTLTKLGSVSYPQEGKCAVPIKVTNDDVTTAYIAMQVGFYAQDPDEGEILYFIAQSEIGKGTEIPSKTEMPGYSAEWTFYFQYGQADHVSVIVDPSNTVTQATMEAFVKSELGVHTGDKNNPHGVTANQIGAIPTTEKGKPDGVATLDSTGKVPPAQWPQMDYIPTSEKGAAGGVAPLNENKQVPPENLPPMNYDPAGAAEEVKDELMILIQDAGGFVLMEEDIPPEQRKENRLYAKQVEEPFTFPENAVDMVNQDYLGRAHIYPSRAEMVRMPDGTMLADHQFETQEDADATKQALEQMITELEGKIPKIKAVWGTASGSSGSISINFGDVFSKIPSVVANSVYSSTGAIDAQVVYVKSVSKSRATIGKTNYVNKIIWIAVGE